VKITFSCAMPTFARQRTFYGEAATADMMEAHGKFVGLALDGLHADCKPS
jgi:hypothetical protein